MLYAYLGVINYTSKQHQHNCIFWKFGRVICAKWRPNYSLLSWLQVILL